MFTFFKNMVKAAIALALLLGAIFLAFGGALTVFSMTGSSNLAALWLMFFLIIVGAFAITLSQDNEFSRRAEKKFNAFWSW